MKDVKIVTYTRDQAIDSLSSIKGLGFSKRAISALPNSSLENVLNIALEPKFLKCSIIADEL